MPALPPLIHDKSRMRRRACTDLCGGRSAMVVPTATVIVGSDLTGGKLSTPDNSRCRKLTPYPKSPCLAQGRRTPLYSNSIISERIFPLQFEPRDQFEQRKKKLEQIQSLGHDPYPREFRWTDPPAALVEKYGETSGPELEANKREVRVAGRIVSSRLMP